MIVPDADVRRVLEGVAPGTTCTSAWLFERYTKIMAEDGRPAAAPQVFGRALTRAGCVAKNVRKMVRGVRTHTRSWVIAGAPPRSQEEDRVQSVIERLGGDGIYPVDTIWNTYLALAREHGWRSTLGATGLAGQLTRMGYDRPRNYRGRRSRYLFARKR